MIHIKPDSERPVTLLSFSRQTLVAQWGYWMPGLSVCGVCVCVHDRAGCQTSLSLRMYQALVSLRQWLCIQEHFHVWRAVCMLMIHVGENEDVFEIQPQKDALQHLMSSCSLRIISYFYVAFIKHSAITQSYIYMLCFFSHYIIDFIFWYEYFLFI